MRGYTGHLGASESKPDLEWNGMGASRRKFITRLGSKGRMNVDKKERGGWGRGGRSRVGARGEFLGDLSMFSVSPIQGTESRVQGKMWWELRMRRAERGLEPLIAVPGSLDSAPRAGKSLKGEPQDLHVDPQTGHPGLRIGLVSSAVEGRSSAVGFSRRFEDV